MHISTNVSHWVCIATGIMLVVTGMVSHVRRQATNEAVTGRGEAGNSGLGKRLVLIGIGLFAVAYGMSRVLG